MPLFHLAALLHVSCLSYLRLTLPGVTTFTESSLLRGAATQTEVRLPYPRYTRRSTHPLLNLNPLSITSTINRRQIEIDLRQKKSPPTAAMVDEARHPDRPSTSPSIPSSYLSLLGPVSVASLVDHLASSHAQGNRTPISLSLFGVSFEPSADRAPLPQPPSCWPSPKSSPSARRRHKGKQSTSSRPCFSG